MKKLSSKKLLVITGTYPPKVCGAGDYTFKLMQSNLSKAWELYNPTNWKFSSILDKIREINKTNSLNINLQYPTMGYKGSFVPHLICIYYSLFTKKHFSVTIHESSQLSLKAKLSTFIFFIFSNKIIFTNTFEQNNASIFIPFLKKKSCVIKIYSNIESAPEIKRIADRKYDLVYFGLLRPQKGLENFLKVVTELKNRNQNINIILAGKTQPEYNVFFEEQIKEAKPYLNTIFLNKEENEITKILSNSKIAYLPFPDGISERRGSALAVLKNEGLIVTTKGKFTTEGFETCCEFANSINEAVSIILNLLSMNEIDLLEKQNKIKSFLDSNFPKSWDEVAAKYINFLQL